MKWARTNNGFTIVELLIVVVVIAILAAITLVAYNGIQNRAKDSSVSSAVSSISKKLETHRFAIGNNGEQYPLTLADAGIQSTSGTTVSYHTTTSRQYYCVDAETGTIRYYRSSLSNTPKPGKCPTTLGLTNWWPLNGTIVDAANGGNGAVNYGATSTAGADGRANGAYQFNGSTNYIDTMSVGSNRNLFSFSVWAYQTKTGTYQTPLSEVRDCCGSGYRGFELKTSYTADNTSVDVWSGGTGAAVGLGTGNMTLNTWVHFTATYDGAELRAYRNGVLVANAPYVGTPGVTIDTLKVGRTGAATAGWFGGSIDDVRVYNRALTGPEVLTLYETGAQ